MANKRITALAATMVAITVLALAGMIVAPSDAQAGTNGQQLKIYDGKLTGLPGYKYVTIEGANQNGVGTTKKYSLDDRPLGHHSVTTSGYWWKGSVTITVTFTDRVSRICRADVPVNSNQDPFWVLCAHP